MKLALDLFCCAGGVAKGLTDAGWYVIAAIWHGTALYKGDPDE